MKTIQERRLWFYPMLFGLLGAFLGLLTRYLFTGVEIELPLKNFIHSHSHVMLLGFLFNALVILLWRRFTNGIDKLSYRYFIALQISIVGMLITFIVQGYGLFSIIFSTAHLWISYVFLIRLWKRLNGIDNLSKLIKVGIIFHFISSIGPYCLGPLMAFDMQSSPWYQQAIFFYLHFQFLGSLFIWLIALWLPKNKKHLSKNLIILLCVSVAGMFAHSLNYNFNHYLINIIGGLSSVGLFIFFFSQVKSITKNSLSEKLFFIILLALCVFNIAGSLPYVANLVIEEHYILIAWLHFIFLGVYVPFIWLETKLTNVVLWVLYALVFLFSQLILLFPSTFFITTEITISWLLFYAYLGVFICFCFVHLPKLIKKS